MPKLLSKILLASTLLAPVAALAEVDYPVDTVRVFVPAKPGGGTDAGARLFAEFFEKHSDATVAIVNQPGGGGVIAAQSVARGAEDGSVLLFFHAALHTANLFGQSPFAWNSFTPLATTSAVNEVYAVRADAPYANMEEFIAYAKAHPGELSVGSQLGGTTQVKGEAINAATGGSLRIVDAGTEADRTTALLGEQVDVISMSVANAKQYAEDGQMNVLAVLNSEPDPAAPEFPTTADVGMDFSLPLTMTVYGPEGVDASVSEAFEAIVAEIAADPTYAERLASQAQVPALRGPADAAVFLEAENKTIAGLLAE
ncbi:MAG: tripartite tricarboxylate transporter substrate binding protein [Rhodobacteraceae bacterium]|nr:tripartite tricarboxylate transporter substrate binding protein [Paracoccaceae bacterium]